MPCIYLDNCCLNRPFDTQSYTPIRLETAAIQTLLDDIKTGEWILVSSDIIRYEIKQTPDLSRRKKRYRFESLAKKHVKVTQAIKNRALHFQTYGLQTFGSAHLASAEHNADKLLTVDERFIKRTRKIANLPIHVTNPLSWLETILP